MSEITAIGSIIITPLTKAKKSLEAALAAPLTDLNRDASIQRFEFTFELTWKTLKRILNYLEIEANNPRDIFRHAAMQNLIESPEEWFVFLENRNLTTHTYDEEIAMMIYNSLHSFNSKLTTLINKITTHE